jgi:mannose-6-phosphate isomerase-like protein (cupin superfamily)
VTVPDVITLPVGAGASVRRLVDQAEWRSTCGMRRDLLGGGEGEPLRFHFLRIHDSRKHRHLRTIEYYFVTHGRGFIELDDQTVEIGEGDLVVVPPGVRHTSRPADGSELHVLLIVAPQVGADGRPDHSADEHFD